MALARAFQAIAALVGEADNAKVVSVGVDNAGGGYGATPPEVTVAPPPTGAGRPARATAHMVPTGRWLDAKVRDGGSGYADDEVVRVDVAPPPDPSGVRARVQAVVRNGTVVQLLLLEPGSGYNSSDGAAARLTIAPPGVSTGLSERVGPRGRRAATGLLRAEFSVGSLELSDAGAGYNADEPPAVRIAPPAPSDADAGGGLEAAARRRAARASVQLSPRPGGGALSAHELSDLDRSLRRATLESPDGLPLPPRGAGKPVLLPAALTPTRSRDAGGGFKLGVRVPEGAFGSRASEPVERSTPLDVPQARLPAPLLPATAAVPSAAPPPSSNIGRQDLPCGRAVLRFRPHGTRALGRRQDQNADGAGKACASLASVLPRPPRAP